VACLAAGTGTLLSRCSCSALSMVSRFAIATKIGTTGTAARHVDSHLADASLGGGEIWLYVYISVHEKVKLASAQYGVGAPVARWMSR
jgi:hypothetical protein